MQEKEGAKNLSSSVRLPLLLLSARRYSDSVISLAMTFIWISVLIM
jgi:hypothetical protein